MLDTGFISNFQNQLSDFETFAQHGFPLSGLVNTKPAADSGDSSATVTPASFAGKVAGALIPGAAVLPQVITIVLGLICIAGAIYLYKPEAVSGAVKRAGAAAAA